MQWPDEVSRTYYRDLAAALDGALIGLDYDGTVAPIVSDPPEATIHPAMPSLLPRLCSVAGTVAIITGRPARQAVALGGLDDLADACPNLIVLGQYGNETWTSRDRRVVSPPPPHGISSFLRELPATLRRLGIEPLIEEKGIAVAVHTRKLPDPADAYRRLIGPISDLAASHDLVIEPGKFVMEARAPGMDKGVALRRLVEATSPSAVVFAGDDLGDIPAFAAVGELRLSGLPALNVCSGSPEEPRIAEAADVVLDGPDGVVAFFEQLLEDASASRTAGPESGK